MRKHLLVLFLLLSVSGFAQSFVAKGKVRDAKTNEPLAFVNIVVKQANTGTTTDIDGNFSIKLQEGDHLLEFSFIGFESARLPVNANSGFLKVFLSESASQLNEVVVLPGINPAHRIINNVIDHKEKNNPENQSSFSYRTYSKFYATVDLPEPSAQDTINSLDSAATPADTSLAAQNDTAAADTSFNAREFLENSYLFVNESVTERFYLPPSRDNETVLATRTSGFKNPLFALLTTQLQSFSFYNEYISIAGQDFLNPISKGSTNRYIFILKDTVYNSPTDTVFIISYLPKPNYGFKPLQGLLYVNSSSWAIQNVIAEPVESEGINVSIEQQYIEYSPGLWFPDQLSAEIVFASLTANGANPYARMRTYLKDVKIGEELKRRDISTASITIDELAVENGEKLLNQYRVDTVSAKEEATYHFLDSIGEEYDFEKRLDILFALASGKIPVKMFDIELDKILKYNTYEGFRLGFGASTNAKFSRWLKLGGYFGYGFKDEELKYGYDAEITVNKHNNFKLYGGYLFDIFESGGYSNLHRETPQLINDSYRRLFIEKWDYTSRYFAGVTFDPAARVHFKGQLQRENRYTRNQGYYLNHESENPMPENGFNYFEFVGAVQFSPNEEFVEAPGYEKLVLNAAYPVYYLQYTRGFNDVWESEWAYDKIDLEIDHRKKFTRIGTSSLNLKAGVVLSDIPYSKLYTGTSNMINSDSFSRRLGMLADRNSFETMRFNEFLADQYIQVMLRQDFKSLLFKRKEFAPHIELVGRAMWGSLRKPAYHFDTETQSPVHGYYEVGLELNRLISNDFSGIGMGVYYRLGAHSLGEFEENIAIKITSKFVL